MKIKIYSLLCLLLLFINLSCKENNSIDNFTYDFNSRAVIIINNTDIRNHSLRGQYYTIIPLEGITSDKIILEENKADTIVYNIHMPSNAYLFIDDFQLPVFLIPNDTLLVSIISTQPDSLLQGIIFNGKYASINKYLLTKYEKFGKSFLDRRGFLFNSDLSLTAYKDSIDIVNKSEMKFLLDYINYNELPDWYVNLAKAELDYKTAESKISRVSYRRIFHKLNDKIPADYFDFLEDIKIDNSDAVFTIEYYLFLSTYIYEKFIPEKNKAENLSSKDRLKSSTPIYLSIADSLLTGEAKDIFKSFQIGFLILKQQLTVADYLIESQQGKMDLKYINFLKDYRINKYALNNGDKSPDFYLLNVNNKYNSLSDYKGKIVLLNFWFPGCKPCIKEIPYEKKLVKDFKDDDFLLINICFFTSKESWTSAINKFKMDGIHLYAVKNWQDKIIREYDIAGYPHYTLIDKNGNIFSNHSKHPSQGIAEDILKLLND